MRRSSFQMTRLSQKSCAAFSLSVQPARQVAFVLSGGQQTMAQFVGSICERCKTPIRSILDGELCGVCARPYHYACPRPSFAKNQCGLCGASTEGMTIAVDSHDTERTNCSRPVPGKSILAGYRAVRWFVGGLASLALGIWLIVDPHLDGRMRFDPSADRTAGTCALVAGIGFCLLAIYQWKRR
jgi:hypothetical protein